MMTELFTRFAVAGCSHFLTFPTWYEYLGGSCDAPTISGINDVWLVVAAAIEILLRVAGLMAVALVMYAGFLFLTSQDEPDKVAQARKTIINALIGLSIAILAAVIVNFIAGSIATQ